MANIEFDRFKALLQKNSFFATAPRLHLFSLLQNHPALTMQELVKLNKKYDQATIYRNIALFERLGIVNKLWLGWNTKIELSDVFQHHHHHVSCTKCGDVVALPEDSDLEKLINELAMSKSFVPSDHQLEIRGLCPKCQRKEIR